MQQIGYSALPSLIDDGNDLFARYIQFLDVSPASARTYVRALRSLEKWLKENGISRPVREDLLAYKKSLQQTLKPATVQSYITVARLFFTFLSDQGIYPNIAERLKGAKVDAEFKKDALTSSQIRRILESIDGDSIREKRDRALILLMITGGLRCAEAAAANVDDLRTLNDKTVLYIKGKGRSEKREFVVVDPRTEDCIRNYLRAREPGVCALFASTSNNNRENMTSRAVSGIVKKRLIAAGFDSDRLTAHSLRHSCVTLALLGNVPLDEVRQHARHKSIQTTLGYSHRLQAQNNRSSAAIAETLF